MAEYRPIEIPLRIKPIMEEKPPPPAYAPAYAPAPAPTYGLGTLIAVFVMGILGGYFLAYFIYTRYGRFW